MKLNNGLGETRTPTSFGHRLLRPTRLPFRHEAPTERTPLSIGGAESMSNVEHYALGLRTGVRQGGIALMDRLDRARETAGGTAHPIGGGMIETAENLRREYGIGREAQDELALRSHQRAVAAHEAGRFADELVPVTVPGKRGKPDTVIDRD